MGYVEAICISRKKGVAKEPISRATFRIEWGIDGDAHAGHWHRQVSLLAGESIDRMKKMLPQLSAGAFAENVITRGVNLLSVRVGDVLRIGADVILQVTQIGKECHTACAIRQQTGDCIMPREGIFARVLQGGEVRPGDEIDKVENLAVLSASNGAASAIELQQ